MNAFLGLGGNLGDPPVLFSEALALLGAVGVATLRRSSLYRSPPLGPPQPDYTNAVVEVATGMEASALLRQLLAVEQRLGRRRDRRWGPRTIDIDILLCGDLAIASAGLTLPHPGLAERAFVLVPLAELAPTARHPLLGKTIEALLAGLPFEQVATVRRLDRGWP